MIFERLLVPLDGSEDALGALPYAEIIPSRSVRLLTAIPRDEAGLLAFPINTAELREQAVSSIKQMMDKAGGEFERQGRDVERVIDDGDAEDSIVRSAADVDLIVMTTRGYGGGRRAMFGSVADRIVQSAPAPVLLVRGGASPVKSGPVQRLVVPLDGSETSERALSMAGNLADVFGIPVALFLALDTERMPSAGRLGALDVARTAEEGDQLRNIASTYLESEARALRNRNIVTTTVVAEGPPAGKLLDLVRPGDVVVMTTHARSGISRWLLGSVAETMVQEADVPILVIRAEED